MNDGLQMQRVQPRKAPDESRNPRWKAAQLPVHGWDAQKVGDAVKSLRAWYDGQGPVRDRLKPPESLFARARQAVAGYHDSSHLESRFEVLDGDAVLACGPHHAVSEARGVAHGMRGALTVLLEVGGDVERDIFEVEQILG